MEDLREMFALAGEDSEAVKKIRRLEAEPWKIKYFGRRLNAVCKERFNIADGSHGFRIELPWEGQEKYVKYANGYDDSTYEHELVVTVYSDGPAKGRIKWIEAHHWDHWHTTSDWHDHSACSTHDVRPSNEKEIRLYEELLDEWTEGGSREQIVALIETLKRVSVESGGRIKVNLLTRNGELVGDGQRYYGSPCFVDECHFSDEFERWIGRQDYLTEELDCWSEREGYRLDWPTCCWLEIKMDGKVGCLGVELGLLERVLDWSHVRIEAMFSPEFRKLHGLVVDSRDKDKKSHVRIADMPWFLKESRDKDEMDLQLQYFLNLFNLNDEQFYWHLKESESMWIYDVFDSCRQYRDLMGLDSATWGHMAWWGLRETMSLAGREDRNRRILSNLLEISLLKYLSTDASRFFKEEQIEEKDFRIVDPLCEFVGSVEVSDQKRFIATWREKIEDFKTEVVNGIKWSYYEDNSYYSETVCDNTRHYKTRTSI